MFCNKLFLILFIFILNSLLFRFCFAMEVSIEPQDSCVSLSQSSQLQGRLKNVFSKPLYLGASITAETCLLPSQFFRAYWLVDLALWGIHDPRHYFFNTYAYGKNPGKILVHHFNKLSSPIDLSVYFTNSNEHLGSFKIKKLLEDNSIENSIFNEATAIIGLDLFYWDAIWNTCGYRKDGIYVEKQIKDLIERSFHSQKLLILGNVPHDKAEYIKIDSETLGIDGLWYKANQYCVNSINKALEENCTLKKNCVLFDFKTFVKNLQNGQSMTFKGQSYSLYDLRPDGVHLSVIGSELIGRHMIETIERDFKFLQCPSSSL